MKAFPFIQSIFKISILILVWQMSSCRPAGKNTISGLNESVEVLRDQWGVNHIYAKNQDDLFFAQGYCAARDRLFQFEIWRRQANGSLSEILGSSELKRDIGARLFKYRGDMAKELNHYHPEGEKIINSFVTGINAYINEVNADPEKLPVEFGILGIKPGLWTPEIVVSRHQGITGNVSDELDISRAVSLAGEEKIKKLMWFHPDIPLLKIDSAIKSDLLFNNILELYSAYHSDVKFEKTDSPVSRNSASIYFNNETYALPSFAKQYDGSNNWVVSGNKTGGKYPVLANDPHRKIALPSLRYIVHLNAPGWNVIGGGEPAIPGISIGHNDFGAWGITIHPTDAEDLFVYDLNPENLSQYRYNNSWKEMDLISESIKIKNSVPVEAILRFTVHGPVTYIDSVNRKAYAVKSATLDPGSAPYLTSLRMDQAKSWTEFREACSYSRIPSLNMVWADNSGDIGWQVSGAIPVRNNFSGMVVVPGDGRYEWQGYLPVKQRPSLLNPEKGYIATANENLVPLDFQYRNAMGFTWADSFRAVRIKEVIENENKLTIEKIKSLQTDYIAVPARSFVPFLKNMSAENGPAKQAAEILLRWNYEMNKDSIAPAIYATWENTMLDEAEKRWIPENIKRLISIQLTKLIHWMQYPKIIFEADAEKERNNFLNETFNITIAKLQKKMGNDISKWTYGQASFKHTQLFHPLNALASEKDRLQFNTVILPRGGYQYTVGATGSADNQESGSSFRMIADTRNWDLTLMTNTPGQSGDPASPFYKNLFESWAKDQYFPAYFSRGKISTVLADSLTLRPR